MAVYVFGCEKCGGIFELMRPILHRDAPAECVYCGFGNVRRKPTIFSRLRLIGTQKDAGSGGVPAESAGHYNVIDCLIDNNGRGFQVDDGSTRFVRTRFKDNRDDIVVTGDAKTYTEDCEFR